MSSDVIETHRKILDGMERFLERKPGICEMFLALRSNAHDLQAYHNGLCDIIEIYELDVWLNASNFTITQYQTARLLEAALISKMHANENQE